MTKLRNITLFLFVVGQSLAQDTTDFYPQIKNYDLSTIWIADSILIDDNEAKKQKIDRPELLGFIDTTFQRFYIHFISVTKNIDNPYEYSIIGKTKVKNNICDFKGIIKVKSSNIFTPFDSPKFKAGEAICEVLFYEDKKQNNSGIIKGNLITNFYFDSNGKFSYDALSFVSDGFCNNQFVGTWTSYKTNKSIKCNWGDFRIPESGDFDMGAGEFSVAEKYVKNGWETYVLSLDYNKDKPETKKAKEIELEEWWKYMGVSNIPKEAFWVGGDDGGNWYLIGNIDEKENTIQFKIYNDYTGDLIVDKAFKLHCENDTEIKWNNIKEQINFFNGKIICLTIINKNNKYCYFE